MIKEKYGQANAQARLIYLLLAGIVMMLAYSTLLSGRLENGLELVSVLFTITLFWSIMVNASFKSTRSQIRLLLPLMVAVGGMLIYDITEAQNWEDGLGFAAVLLAAVMPALFWIRGGTRGVPILPAVSILYIVYFGISAVRGVGEQAGYTPQQVLTACLTVAIFLIIASLTNNWICSTAPVHRPSSARFLQFSDRQAVRLVYIGLGLGLFFYIANFAGWLDWAGSLWGVIRSICLSAAALASFLLGYGRARKILAGPNWLIVCAEFLLILLFSISSLFLVGVVTTTLAALTGYIVTARRIPWRLLLVTFLVISVFQAGKKDMREQYWGARGSILKQMSLSDMPGVALEWFEVGTEALIMGTGQSSVIDRASLLNQLIRIEEWTPKFVPYLYGDTYTYLPYIMVPRFLMTDKPTSQVVMSKLDVRYGFLSAGETRYVSVGVALISEGFANFGYFGVVLIGIVFGLLTGYFTRLSSNRNAVSLPVLLSIVTFVTLMNLEADLSYLLTSLFQSLISVTIFFFAFQFVFEPKYRRAMLSRAPKSLTLRRPLERT